MAASRDWRENGALRAVVAIVSGILGAGASIFTFKSFEAWRQEGSHKIAEGVKTVLGLGLAGVSFFAAFHFGGYSSGEFIETKQRESEANRNTRLMVWKETHPDEAQVLQKLGVDTRDIVKRGDVAIEDARKHLEQQSSLSSDQKQAGLSILEALRVELTKEKSR